MLSAAVCGPSARVSGATTSLGWPQASRRSFPRSAALTAATPSAGGQPACRPSCSLSASHAAPRGRSAAQRILLAAAAASPAAASPAAAAGQKGRHAVVIGAGLAGLAAAKVLARHFERVTVLERDAFTANVAEAADSRPGVPQFQQPHVLLARGIRALDAIFGDFRGALLEAGGLPMCYTRDIAVYDWGVPLMRTDSDITSVSATRGLMEQTARSLLLEQEAGVTLQSGATVAGLVFAEDGEAAGGKRVAGVRLKDGSALEAELVVDVSGRSSRASEWLAGADLAAPPVLEVDGHLGYATRLYHIPEGYQGTPGGMVGGRPSFTRGAILIPVEGNRWQLILGGYNRDYPPTDEQGFQAFIESLLSPIISRMLKGATPAGPIGRYMGTRNMRRQYEKIDMPPGFVVMGDAAVSFNPVYGQGITVGVLEAEELGSLLDRRLAAAGGGMAAALRGLPNEFQRRVAGIVDTPWMLAVSEDSKWPGCDANYQVPQSAQLIRPYFAAVARAASHSESVFDEYVRILHMLSPPTHFFKPHMLLGAAWYGFLLPLLARLPLVGRRFAAPAAAEAGTATS